LPLVRIYPEWVSLEWGNSSGRIANSSHWTGMFSDGISSIPDETVVPLWLGRQCFLCGNGECHEKVMKAVGRKGYGITHRYPL